MRQQKILKNPEEKLLSILEDQGNSCTVHNRTSQVSVFLHHVMDCGGNVDGAMEECSSPTHGTNTAQEEDQGNNPGIPHGIAKECNSPNRNSIVALDKRHGVFKARIPMARLRNALDDEDSSDRGGFRCAECSKCLTCKTSNKRTATSLRAAREQQLIEESVKIDLVNRIVTVNYSFLKDPVEFLSSIHKNPSNYSQALRFIKYSAKNQSRSRTERGKFMKIWWRRVYGKTEWSLRMQEDDDHERSFQTFQPMEAGNENGFCDHTDQDGCGSLNDQV